MKLPNGYFDKGDNYGRGYKGTDFENRAGTVCAERLSGQVILDKNSFDTLYLE